MSGGVGSGGSQLTPTGTQPGAGVSMMSPAAMAAFDSASSTTRSAISPGAIILRDADAQSAATGKSVAATLASLNRDALNSLNDLQPIFKRDKVQARLDIGIEAQQQLATFVAYKTRDIQDLEERANDASLPQAEREAAAREAAALAAHWGPTGSYRRIANAVVAGASVNAASGVMSMVQAGAVNYLQALSAERVKEIADTLGEGPKAEAARAALHAVVGCAGAAASAVHCGAGALGAGAGSVLNALLDAMPQDAQADADDPSNPVGPASRGKPMAPQQQERRRHFIASMVAGIALATGMNPAAAMTAGIAETENNYMNARENRAFFAAQDELEKCRDEACRKTAEAAMEQQRQAGLGRHFAVSALSGSPAEAAARREALRADINDLQALAQGLPDERAKHVNRQLAAAQSKLYESLWESVQAAQMDLSARGEDLSGPRGAALVQGGYLSEVDGHEFDVVHGEMPARMADAFAGAVGSRARGPARAAGKVLNKQVVLKSKTAARPGDVPATGGGSITIDEARAKHIFRDAEGHISDTPINRRLLENLANDPSAVLGTDKYGNTWAARLNADGTQTWIAIRGGKVSYGGVNQTPKPFHPETGLASPTRPGRKK